MEQHPQRVSAWFRALRNRICQEFERLEMELTGRFHELPPGRFIRTLWQREEGGGGEMSVMKGRVFEKVGVNISTVWGAFSESMRKEIPGAETLPYFWASGISLVAHMRSPLVPAVHMNTRMIALSAGTHNAASAAARGSLEPVSCEIQQNFAETNKKSWFGGGADLTPIFPDAADTDSFHAALEQACDAFDPGYYQKYKVWCDEYFFLKHRGEPRGVGGIFFDYLDSGEWERDFAFTRAVGEAFAEIYPRIVRRHMDKPWTQEQREVQLLRRGRYVEFNLLYDRGTRFGLMTGGNVEAILMSLPPEVKWG